MTGKSAGGRDMYAVVINALETAAQKRDYAHWQPLRRIELADPATAQKRVAAWGGNVKMPIYIEANINGNEYEGTDAMMQVIRDLATTPYGQNPTVDKLLDHCDPRRGPDANPDGRVMGIRGNAAVADTNRDYFLQSQPEEQIDSAIQQEYLAPGALHLHGYVTPTLIDGLTMPHNPGLEYDIFAKWNQAAHRRTRPTSPPWAWGSSAPSTLRRERRLPRHRPLDAAVDIARNGATQSRHDGERHHDCRPPHGLTVGDSVTVAGVSAFYGGYNGTFTVRRCRRRRRSPTSPPPRPRVAVERRHCMDGRLRAAGNAPARPTPRAGTTGGPSTARRTWAFSGVDGSTVEMTQRGRTGRLVSKPAQYIGLLLLGQLLARQPPAMMSDQLQMFRPRRRRRPLEPPRLRRRPVARLLSASPTPPNWMVPYPKAYIIPFGSGQRSDAEANRLVEWLLATTPGRQGKQDFTWNGKTYKAGSYVVSMNQALRGLGLGRSAAGTDIEGKISILYAPPAAWSHGLCWGADTVEVPRGDATFAPKTLPVSAPNALAGGVRGGVSAPADWYSVTLKGVHQDQAILGVLRAA